MFLGRGPATAGALNMHALSSGIVRMHMHMPYVISFLCQFA